MTTEKPKALKKRQKKSGESTKAPKQSRKRKAPEVKRKRRASSEEPKMWWEGGTLHESDLGEYFASSEANQMATIADFITYFKKTFRTHFIFNNPNELLVKYVVPVMAVINEAAREYHDLWDQPVFNAAYVAAGQLNFIPRPEKTVAEAIKVADEWREMVETGGMDVPRQVQIEKREAEIKKKQEEIDALYTDLSYLYAEGSEM